MRNPTPRSVMVWCALTCAPLLFQTACTGSDDPVEPAAEAPPRLADAFVIGAYPAVRQGETWVKACDGVGAEGLLVHTALVSLGSASDPDEERAIRDQDVTLSPARLGLDLGCVDPLPDLTGAPTCEGATFGPATIEEVTFEAYADRGAAVNVLVLVDMSGSILGLVDADTGKESRPGAISNLPSTLTSAASDFQGLRLAAVNELVQDLDSNIRVGVVGFGEGLGDDQLRVPCADPEASGLDWHTALNLCLPSADRELWTGTGGIETLQSGVDGRSNLWQALDDAYGYLESAPLTGPSHIVVITDGPDTCAPSEDAAACEAACSEVTSADFLARVVGSGSATRVHFVQFESMGYRGPDPRQIEVACASGGHYQFINSESIPRQNPAFADALVAALDAVRMSLRGTWQVAVAAPALESAAGPPVGTPRGGLYALDGTLEIRATSQIVGQDSPFRFVGGSAGDVDERLVFKKSCSAAADCGADPAGDSCQVVCSPETGLCAGGAALPDATPCEGGVCCAGECVSGVCDACSD